MTTYLVLAPPAKGDDVHAPVADAVFVPEARALWALVLPLPWLLWNRLWWAAIFYVLVSIILAMTLTLEPGILALLLTFLPGFFLYLEGHELRHKRLERRGWKLTGIVRGDDRVEAEIRFFSGLRPGEENSGKRHPVALNSTLLPVDTGMDFLASPEAF